MPSPFLSLAILLLASVTLFSGFSWWPEKILDNFRNPFIAIVIFASLISVLSKNAQNFWRTFFLKPEKIIEEEKETRWVFVILGWHLFIFVKICLLNYFDFLVNATDFSIYDFMIPNTARGRFMQSMTGFDHFGTHSTPILFLVYPFHRFFNSPYFSLILHGILLWSASIPLYLILKSRIKAPIHRLLILLTFFHFSYVGQILQYNYHIEIFYTPLFFWLFYFWDTEKYIWSVVVALLLMTVKEDGALYVISATLALSFWKKNSPLWMKVGLVLVSVAVFIINIKWVIPMNSGKASYLLAPAASSSGTLPQTIFRLLGNWKETASLIFTGSWLRMTALFLFLPLLEPAFLIGSAPFILIHATAQSPIMRSLMLYYSAPYIPFLFFGYVLALSKTRLTRYRSPIILLVCGLATLIGGGYLQFHKPHPQYKELVKLRMIIDKNKSICIQGSLTPHFGYPDKYHLLTPECVRETLDYYVLDPNLSAYPVPQTDFFKLVEDLKNDSRYEQQKFGEFILFRKRVF
jgi:uncharacterized membrane protein